MKLKHLSLGLVCCAFFLAAPAPAQDEWNGNEDGNGEDALDRKSDQELAKEALELLESVADEMKDMQKDFAKASLPARKADELKAELDSILEKLKSGEETELPAGLKEYFQENPEKLGEVLKSTTEEAKKLLEDNEALLKRLGENAGGLRELLDDSSVLEGILKLQKQVERNMEELLENQSLKGKQTENDVDGLLQRLYKLRRS